MGYFRYWLLDSWWYYQGKGQGVKKWEARPEVFPHGMQKLFADTAMPVQAHNRFVWVMEMVMEMVMVAMVMLYRYWSTDNVYTEKYKFSMGSQTGLPEQRVFWDDLFSNALQWGLRVYEQDW